MIGELAEAVDLSRGIINAILNEEDPIQCPFTNAETFPAPEDRRDAVRKWAGVLDASPRDAFAALEADGCTYDDDEEAEDAHTNPNQPIAMSKPNQAPEAKPGNPDDVQPAEQTPPDRTAELEARLKQVEAENARLAEQRRAASLAALQRALAGRVPKSAVEALVELAEVADKAAGGKALSFEKPIAAAKEKTEASIIDRLAAIASGIQPMVKRRLLDTSGPTGDGASEDAEIAKATAKM